MNRSSFNRFPPCDTNTVLREFEKCGTILRHVPGPGDANWMHIIYQVCFISIYTCVFPFPSHTDILIEAHPEIHPNPHVLDITWRSKNFDWLIVQGLSWGSHCGKPLLNPCSFSYSFIKLLLVFITRGLNC